MAGERPKRPGARAPKASLSTPEGTPGRAPAGRPPGPGGRVGARPPRATALDPTAAHDAPSPAAPAPKASKPRERADRVAPPDAPSPPLLRAEAEHGLAESSLGPAGSSEGPGHAPSVAPGGVLVTGICGRLGRVFTRLMHRERAVVGIDRRAFHGRPKDVVHHQFDLRRKKTRDIFRAGGIDAVVHLGIMHDLRASAREHHTWNVVAFQKLLEHVAQYRVRKLVVLSSANVYGPSPDNAQFLTEDAPLLGAQHFSEIRDLVEVDMLAQSFFWRHPEIETVILRPCHILGTVKNAPSNYLRFERPITLMGFDPMVQVIHERDVARALALALRPGVRGIFNLKGPGEVPLSRALRILGRKPTALPAPLVSTALSNLWRYRLTSFPVPELDHIRYVCMVDDARARDVLGFAPTFSLEETVRAVLD